MRWWWRRRGGEDPEPSLREIEDSPEMRAAQAKVDERPLTPDGPQARDTYLPS
jgi:hypothetical protein